MPFSDKNPRVGMTGLLRPVVAITMGDAAGIGPEVILKALSDASLLDLCRPAVIGDAEHLRRVSKELNIPFSYSVITADEREPEFFPSIFDLCNLPESVEAGVESAVAGKAAGEYIETAVGLWRKGIVDAIATAPISKRSLNLGGYNFPGHTEFLASLTGTKEFAMSFFGGNLRVVLISTHVPLTTAIQLVTKERLGKLIRFTTEHLEILLGKKIRLAVAGLNPHASEGGMFGSEEADEIAPAIAECRDAFGIDVSGPYSPDTIFLRGFRGEFDAVIACYHDQATIAVKSLAFGTAVNVTLGLPLIRASVDHGTAFDIAGKGVADESSMKAAIRLAAELSLVRSTAI